MQDTQNNTNSLIEEKLKESEERFSLAMKGANDGLWDWNLLTDEVYYSPRWKSMLGYEDFELENHINTWSKLVSSKDRERVLKEVEDCVDGNKEEFEIEMNMHHKDGYEVTVLSRAFLVKRDLDYKAVRLVGTHVDITERKKAEVFMKETNQILEMIGLGTPASKVYDAIALMYEKRHPGMRCSLLELKEGKLLHGGAPSMPKEYCDAVHGLEIGPNVGSCGASTHSGKRVIVDDIRTNPNWAEIKDVALPHGMRCCWSEPIIDSSGKVLGAFGMYYDYPALPTEEESSDLISAARLTSIVMERDQAQKRIHQDQKIISEQSKMAAMGEMLGNIAHQWRQPLSVISTAATGLILQVEMKLISDKDLKHTLTTINEFTQHLSSTIEDFRSFFDPKNTKFSDFKISTVIEKTLKLVGSQLKEKGIEVIQAIDDFELYSIENELLQVLLNMLNNSKDALLSNDIEKKLIFIKTYEKDGKYYLEVLDNANGIDEDIIDRVFEPYFTTKHQKQGTGIGLYMSREIIENHLNGKIIISNEVYKYDDTNYKGAKFKIAI